MENVYHKNGAEFKVIEDRNGHIRKEVDEGVNISWVGVQTKGGVHKRKLAKKILLHSDLLTSLNSY